MVTPIDAVRCGMGFDERCRWHQGALRGRRISSRKAEDEGLALVRGMAFGLLFSALLWIGIIAAAKFLLRAF